MLNGADWSAYQGLTPDCTGLDFAIIKVTEGSTVYDDRTYKAQIAWARKHGLIVGHYHFGHAHPSAEVDYFLSHVDAQPGDFFVYDWEAGDAVNTATKDTWLRGIKAKRPKIKAGLYCNTNFWLHIDTDSYCGDFLYIADPNHAPGKPGISHSWVFDQYTIRNGVDQDVANFATKAAMAAYFAWTSTPTVVPPAPKPTAPAPAPKPTTHLWTDKTTWGGHVVNYGTAQALTLLQHFCGFALRVLQGSYNTTVAASGGTHAGGNAVDLAVPSDPMKAFYIAVILTWARWCGFAAWHRTPDQGPWVEHIHMILTGGGDPSPAAAAQISEYRAGRNGLANRVADDFWRPNPLRQFIYNPKG